MPVLGPLFNSVVGLLITDYSKFSGTLLMNEDNLLPLDNVTEMDCGENGCFLAGDARTNENIGLASMHTLWARQHNLVAEQISNVNPHWSSDTIFYETRKIIGATFQKIVYFDYLPTLIKKLPKYKGYNEDVDATIRSGFSTAAYRFGHSQVEHSWSFLNNLFKTKVRDDITLQQNFFQTDTIFEEGIEPILFGMVTNSSEKIDSEFVVDLVEKLFVKPNTSGFDNLIARNIQRGRDHGLPGYIQYKAFCEGKNLTGTSDNRFSVFRNRISKTKVAELKKTYKSVHHVDLYVGGILETPKRKEALGPTFACLLRKQFLSSRDGDRFYFENTDKTENPGAFTKKQIKEIKKITLAKVLCDNLENAQKMRKNVFLKTGDLEDCTNKAVFKDIDYTKWKTDGSDSSFIEDEELEEDKEDLEEDEVDLEQDEFDEEDELDEELEEEIQDVYEAEEEVSD